MTSHNEGASEGRTPAPDESSIPELEDDETIAPLPEEEIADAARAEPDLDNA